MVYIAVVFDTLLLKQSYISQFKTAWHVSSLMFLMCQLKLLIKGLNVKKYC